LLEEVLRQVAAGETPKASPGSTGALVERWLADRKAAGKKSAAHEAARLREYVIPRIGNVRADELRPQQVRALVRELQRTKSPRGGVLAARTVLHVYRTLRQVFAEAVADELLERNPVVLKRADLPAKLDKDPAWRAGAQFTAEEVAALVYDGRVPEDRRVLYAIEFLGGLRTGEAAARRWRDWDDSAEPLGGLLVATSFDARTRTEGPTKTKRPRRVPVHPVTADLLRTWKTAGWLRAFGRLPEPEDLICPAARGGFRAVNRSYRLFTEDLVRLGLRHRRHYDTRRTFISLGVAGGGRKDVLRWITHSPGDIFDEYTTLPWETLCVEVSKLRIEPPTAQKGVRLVSSATIPVTLAVTLAESTAPIKDEAPETTLVSGAPLWRGVGDSNPCPSA
jgi:integrase